MARSAVRRDSAAGVFQFAHSCRKGFCGPGCRLPSSPMPNTPWQSIGAISASSWLMRPAEAVSENWPSMGSLRVSAAFRWW